MDILLKQSHILSFTIKWTWGPLAHFHSALVMTVPIKSGREGVIDQCFIFLDLWDLVR